MIGRVTWVDYSSSEELGLYARLSIRMEDRSRRNLFVTGVEPWFYAPESEGVPDSSNIVGVESGYESLFGDRLNKIVTEHPQDTNDLKGSFTETFESDLPFYRKLSIHDGLSGYIELPEKTSSEDVEVVDIAEINTEVEYNGEIVPRALLADIEVHIGEDSFEETKEKTSEPIIAISSYDTYSQEYKVYFYDEYESLTDRGGIREYLKEHWDDERGDIPVELVLCDSEEEMLASFFDDVEDGQPDLIGGWNWCGYDHPYLIGRSKGLDKINIDRICPFGYVSGYETERKITGIPGFDLMDAFNKMTFQNWRSMALDYIAEDQLGVGKVDDVDINRGWKEDGEKLIAYNIIDTQLLVELNEVNSIIPFFYDLADRSSIPIFDTFSELRLVDGFIMSRRDDDEVLPEATEKDLSDNAGGFVGTAPKGLYDNVGVVDAASLYPSCMITFNISTETLYETPPDSEHIALPHVPEPKNVDGEIQERDIDGEWLYCTIEEQGIIPKNVKLLFDNRNEAKAKRDEFEPDTPEYESYDRQQGAIKVIQNSFFGVSASPYWRLSKDKIGGAITSSARYVLWKGIQSCRKHGYDTLYQDTDSNFITIDEEDLDDAVDELFELEQKINDDMSEIAHEVGYVGDNPFLVDEDLHGDNKTCFEWEGEKLYEKFIQIGKKKRYAGTVAFKDGKFFDPPKIDIMGFENRRSDSMTVTASLQEEVLRMILTDSSFEEVSSYIRSIIDEIDADNEDVNKFALPGSINKDLEDYPNRQIPRACMYSNEYLGYEFGEGDNPFVYLVEETPSDVPNTDVVAFEWNEEIPDGFKLDDEAIIERGIKKPIEPIINEVGWKMEELKMGKEQQTFEVGESSSGNPFA